VPRTRPEAATNKKMKTATAILIVAALFAQHTYATQANGPASVEANQIGADYKGNIFSADAKYKNKPLLISGTILDIDKTSDGEPLVVVGSNRLNVGVALVFASGQAAHLATVLKGQRVSAQCLGRGGRLNGDTGVGEASACRLQATVPAPPTDDCQRRVEAIRLIDTDVHQWGQVGSTTESKVAELLTDKDPTAAKITVDSVLQGVTTVQGAEAECAGE